MLMSESGGLGKELRRRRIWQSFDVDKGVCSLHRACDMHDMSRGREFRSGRTSITRVTLLGVGISGLVDSRGCENGF